MSNLDCSAKLLEMEGVRIENLEETEREIVLQISLERCAQVCKRCGARMVLRTAQTGAHKGQKFWGCSNYPVCRFTIRIEDGGE